MSLSDQPGLVASIANWMDRQDLTAVIPDFITLFEADALISLPLKTIYNLTKVALVTSGSSNQVALPSDFLAAKALINQGPAGASGVAYAPINIVSIESLYGLYPQPNADVPKACAIVGSFLEFAPYPSGVYNLNFYYYKRATPLTAAAPTNWLMTNFPQLYLFGTLIAAEAFLGTDPRMQTWGGFYQTALDKIQASADSFMYGGSLAAQPDSVI